MTTAEKPDCERVRELIVALTCKHYTVSPDEVTSDSNYSTDFRSDSLDFVELIIGIEESLHITIDDSVAFSSNVTVQQLTDTIWKLVS